MRPPSTRSTGPRARARPDDAACTAASACPPARPIPPLGRGDGLAARPDRPDDAALTEVEAISPAMCDALGPLPRLHGLRHRLSIRRPLRPAARGHPAQLERNTAHAGATRLAAPALRAFTHPGRLRWLARSRRWARLGARWIGRGSVRSRFAPCGARAPPQRAGARCRGSRPRRGAGHVRGRVALLQGCVQRVFFGTRPTGRRWPCSRRRASRCMRHASRAAAARSAHAGYEDEALRLAQGDVEALERYETRRRERGRMRLVHEGLRPPAADDPEWAERAAAFIAKVRDVTELLASIEPLARSAAGLRRSPTTTPATWLTRRVCGQPRELLTGIPELEVVEPREWEVCCGSAGIYNLLKPPPRPSSGGERLPTWPTRTRTRSPPPTPAAPCRSRPTPTASAKARRGAAPVELLFGRSIA